MKSSIRFRLGALVALLSILGAIQSAEASLITINMQGTVNSVDAALAGTFSNGQTMNLSYTFESTTAARAGSNSTFAVFDALTSFNFSIGGYSASSNSSSELQVDNNPPTPDDDRYGLVSRASQGLTGADVNGLALDSFDFRFDDSTDAVFSNALNLPTSVNLADFTSNNFFVFFTDGATAPVTALVSGTFSSITVTNPNVPEPATLSLLGMGLSGLGLLRRRARA